MFQYLGKSLLFLFVTFVITVSFQNCSKGITSNGVSTLNSLEVDGVIIDMHYNGGPGIYEGAHLELHSNVPENSNYKIQWYYQSPIHTNGFPMENQTLPILILDNVQLSQQGTYWLGVTDAQGEMTISNKVDVEVKPSVLKSQPSNAVVAVNGNAQFKAVITEGETVDFRWEWKRPGTAAFEPLPLDDAKITGVTEDTLKITGVEVAKHVAMYRLKLTDQGDGGAEPRVFYSQEVNLGVIKTNLPAAINNIAFKSSFNLTFDGVGVQRRSDEAVVLSNENQIRWQMWDRNTNKYVNIMDGKGGLVTGKVLTVASANPRYTKYRALILTQNNSGIYSQQTTVNYSSAYQVPSIEFMTIGGRIRYDKRADGKYEVRDSPSFLRSEQTVHSSATTGHLRRWYSQRPDDTAFVTVLNADDSPYTELNREISGLWNVDVDNVDYKIMVQDGFGVRSYSNVVSINNSTSSPFVTLRIPVGQQRIIMSDVRVHNQADGRAITDSPPVTVTWQRKTATGGWEDMTGDVIQKTITMPANSQDEREFRIRYENSKGVSGTLTTYHYFKVVKVN